MAEEVKQSTEEKLYGKDGTGAPEVKKEEPAPEPEKKEEAPAPEPEKKVEDKPEQKDSKPEGDKKPDEKIELKLPEGSLLDAKRVDEIASFAKEQGLSQETAQKLLERESGAVSTFVEKTNADFSARTTEWLKECESDKEFGGAAFKENVELAKRVIGKYGSEKLKGELEKGFGNYPELVRIFVRIGKEMGDDKLVLPGGQPPRKKSLEEKFYPNSAQK